MKLPPNLQLEREVWAMLRPEVARPVIENPVVNSPEVAKPELARPEEQTAPEVERPADPGYPELTPLSGPPPTRELIDKLVQYGTLGVGGLASLPLALANIKVNPIIKTAP